MPIEVRQATQADVPFIVQCIAMAEATADGRPTYAHLFGLSDAETLEVLTTLAAEDIEGCELCWPSFWLLFEDQKPLAGLAAWREAADGLPSAHIKAQLLSLALGPTRFLAARPALELLSAVELPRTKTGLQLDAIAVVPEARGRGLLMPLMEAVLAHYRAAATPPTVAEILLMCENTVAEHAYGKLGFTESARKQGPADIGRYLGGTCRLKMARQMGK